MQHPEYEKSLKKAVRMMDAPLRAIEAAEYLRVSTSTFHDKVKQHLPYVQAGGRRVYLKQDLDEYLMCHRVEVNSPFLRKIHLPDSTLPKPSKFKGRKIKLA